MMMHKPTEEEFENSIEEFLKDKHYLKGIVDFPMKNKDKPSLNIEISKEKENENNNKEIIEYGRKKFKYKLF